MAVLCFLLVPAAAQARDARANDPDLGPVALTLPDSAPDVFPTNKQNEPSIAFNAAEFTANPSGSAAYHMVAGANDEQEQPKCGPGPRRGADAPLSDCSFFPGVGTDGVYTSANGGETWRNEGLIDDAPAWRSANYISDGDPVIVSGPKPAPGGGFTYANGARFYYIGLGSEKQSSYNGGKGGAEAIVVSYNDNNGAIANWSKPVAATRRNPITFNDKNSGWVDRNPSSPHFGKLYVGFTMFRSATLSGNGNEPIGVTRSTDGGNSFGKVNQLSPAGNNGTGNGRQGSDIYTGPDGSVYVAFEQGSAQVVAISRDGGVSYSRPITIGPVTDLDDPIPGANFRTDSFPSIAADQGPAGTVYASWTNRTGTAPTSRGVTVLYKSTNSGQSWSRKNPAVSTAPGYAFFDSLDVAPNGRVDVGYQSLVVPVLSDRSTFGTGKAKIDAYVAQSGDGGSTFTTMKTTPVSSDPAASAQNNLQRQFWGDYNTAVSSNDKSWFIYTDSRTGAGCPAVDAYQQQIAAGGPAVGEEPDDPNAGTDAPGTLTKPAPPTDCPPNYGDTNAFVGLVP
ncbi:MAG: sialidase family protein [Solirubrobacteraceae bacterium]